MITGTTQTTRACSSILVPGVPETRFWIVVDGERECGSQNALFVLVVRLGRVWPEALLAQVAVEKFDGLWQ